MSFPLLSSSQLSSRIACLAVSVVFAIGVGAAGAAPTPLRIAVAPFETVAGDSPEGRASASSMPPVAKLLAGRLARRELERLIAPDAMVAEAVFEPNAEEVRRWAHNAAVDAVVVGRVTALEVSNGTVRHRVEAVVRSGHSGAELYRHAFDLDAGNSATAGLAAALDPLAVAILGDFGHVDTPAAAAPTGKGPASIEPKGAKAGADESTPRRSGHGLDADLGLSGFQSDAPIEIQADEAEIISRGEDRQLIFQRNVRVRQANVLLQSDRLEAEYRKGESEPRKLVARGRVKIDQGDRKASCDQAVYLREAQRLTCRGHAELVQGCDVVRGEAIEFDLAGDQARVEGAASIVIRPDSADADSAKGEKSDSVCAPTRGLM